jgi:hypothetical protein
MVKIILMIGAALLLASKCASARKAGSRALRSRPQEAVPRCSTGK